MYKVNFKEYYKIINWNVIYWGIKKDIIEPSSAIDYANEIIENNSNENESLLVELFILEKSSKDEILSLIGEYIAKGETEERATKILRYIILDSMRKKNKEGFGILDNVESVYADFGYPPDMNSFISYMPIEDDDYDSTKHTRKENEQRLLQKFDIFLEKEKQQI